jgi:hypothetical protein
VFDIVAPIRYTDAHNRVRYAPLLVQIKSSFDDLGNKQVTQILHDMTDLVKTAGHSTGLCLCVRFGHGYMEKPSQQY